MATPLLGKGSGMGLPGCPSRRLSGTNSLSHFVTAPSKKEPNKAVPFGEGGGEAVGRGSIPS